MNTLLHILLILFYQTNILNVEYNNSNLNKEIWLVKSQSTLKVDGKTNINSFNCVVKSYNREDTMVCNKSLSIDASYDVTSQLIIPIEYFDCHHNIMTRDLQKTLKASTYPNMVIDFNHFSMLPSESIHIGKFLGNADIRLAGQTKNYTIYFTSRTLDNHSIELIGRKSIQFSDFRLVPPSKLGGTIKVKDQLDVEFKLYLFRIH